MGMYYKASYIYITVEMTFLVTSKPLSHSSHVCIEVIWKHTRVLSYVQARKPYIKFFFKQIQIMLAIYFETFFS